MKHNGMTDATRRQLLRTLPGLLGLLLAGCQPGSPLPNQPAVAQPTTPPDTKSSPPACPICGMPVLREESENFFEATLPNQPPVLLCSAVCAVVYTDRHPEVTRLDVFDYQRRTLVPPKRRFTSTNPSSKFGRLCHLLRHPLPFGTMPKQPRRPTADKS